MSINVTVSFTVPQALAVGEAIERGLSRREAEGVRLDRWAPSCTMMVGRLDDWLKEVAARGRAARPGHLEWAGVAAFKRAYGSSRAGLPHPDAVGGVPQPPALEPSWSGGDVVVSPPFAWQVRIDASGLDAAPHHRRPRCSRDRRQSDWQLAEFRRAYEPDGLTRRSSTTTAPPGKTLRQFLAANNELEALVRDVITPAP